MRAQPDFMLASSVAWALTAIVCDARARRIPNGLVLVGAALATLGFAFTGSGSTGEPWARCCLVAAGVGVLGIAAYRWGHVGAGDVKFLIVLALLGGVEGTGRALLVGGLLAGAWTLVVTTLAPLGTGARHGAWASDLPVAVPIGIGFLSALASIAAAGEGGTS